MPIKPPKCKTCGKEEYRHLCSGPAPVNMIEPAKPSKKSKPKKAQK